MQSAEQLRSDDKYLSASAWWKPQPPCRVQGDVSRDFILHLGACSRGPHISRNPGPASLKEALFCV